MKYKILKEYKSKKQYRRKGYDYSQDGFYFVTICTKNREMFFGEIENEKMKLSDVGLIANKFWLEIPKHFKFVRLDEYMIMPNHIHGIIQIDNAEIDVGTGQCPVPTNTNKKIKQNISKFGRVIPNSLSTIIGSYKSIVKKTTNEKLPNFGFTWQSRFYDRIIRNNAELNKIRQYIINNPIRWEFDRNNIDMK